MALEHVAQGQTRLLTPGIAPDARGVVLGRHCLLVFPTLEGVVSWFRLYSAEASIDELMAGLEVIRARTPLGSRDMLIRIPAVSSYLCDRAARLTRLVGGAVYTGTSKHFVKYRDDRSPYGYDAIDVAHAPPGAELLVHGDDYVQSYVQEGVVPFTSLLFRLSIRIHPGGARLSEDERGSLLVAVVRGLSDGVTRYLWRNKVEGEAVLVEPLGASAFADQAAARSYLLLRVRRLPERILELFLGVPGIQVFREVSASAAVAVGYAHPIDLSSCASAFPADRFHLFWPDDRVDVVQGPLQFSQLSHLTKIDLQLEPRADEVATTRAPDLVAVGLRLVSSFGPSRRVMATLVPLAHAGWLKRLIFMLPPSSLRGHRIVQTHRGFLIVGSTQIDVIPLGRLLCEAAPGLLIPVGMDVAPRVSAEVLARALGHSSGHVTVFSDERPFQVGDSELLPLERRAIAALEIERAEVSDMQVAELGAPTVSNDPVGRFALWGFPSAPDRKLLP
jgi:hypothetical protein